MKKLTNDMKLLLISLFFIHISFNSFSQDSLTIVLTADYSKDTVEILIGKKVVYKNIFTTDHRIGFAGSFSVRRQPSKKTTDITVRIGKMNQKLQLDNNYHLYHLEYDRNKRNFGITAVTDEEDKGFK